MTKTPDMKRSSGAAGEAELHNEILDRNIAALVARRKIEARRAGFQEHLADNITKFAGSMTFVYLHLAIFGGWIIANLGWIPGVSPWDPSMVVLAMIASVEAIFVSTFVLISQNRMALAADKRADLNLQISLLNEHETTKLIAMMSAIAEHLDVHTGVDGEVGKLTQEVTPDAVLDEIERSDTRAKDADTG